MYNINMKLYLIQSKGEIFPLFPLLYLDKSRQIIQYFSKSIAFVLKKEYNI